PRREAAEQLRWPLGTLQRRLERGRELLRGRLENRGVALTLALAAAGMTEGVAPAAVPAPLASAALKTAALFAAGKAVATGAISTRVAALSTGVLNSLWFSKAKTVTAIALVVGLLGT